MKIVVCSGGFDPLHSGHITYFRAAQALGDKLIVGINSDEWLQRKKGKPFMSWYERSLIVGSIRFVDFTMSFDDDDDSAIALLERVKVFWPNEEIIFANYYSKKNPSQFNRDGFFYFTIILGMSYFIYRS